MRLDQACIFRAAWRGKDAHRKGLVNGPRDVLWQSGGDRDKLAPKLGAEGLAPNGLDDLLHLLKEVLLEERVSLIHHQKSDISQEYCISPPVRHESPRCGDQHVHVGRHGLPLVLLVGAPEETHRLDLDMMGHGFDHLEHLCDQLSGWQEDEDAGEACAADEPGLLFLFNLV